jgi:hypothetical protein
MRPMQAALAGALIAGTTMFAVGTRAFNSAPEPQALVQTADGGYAYVPANSLKPLSTFGAQQQLGYVASPATQFARTAPVQTVYRPAATRTVAQRTTVVEQRPKRSWQKSALVIGGSAASGAGVGAIVGGKKGALIGTALGGGAASIYEATRRR